jgi:hypothetical protein
MAVIELSTLQDRFYSDLNKMSPNNFTEYIDFVTDWCFKEKIEVETVASIIKSNTIFKSLILKEGRDLNMIKKEA